jgi:hypothetical protein
VGSCIRIHEEGVRWLGMRICIDIHIRKECTLSRGVGLGT